MEDGWERGRLRKKGGNVGGGGEVARAPQGASGEEGRGIFGGQGWAQSRTWGSADLWGLRMPGCCWAARALALRWAPAWTRSPHALGAGLPIRTDCKVTPRAGAAAWLGSCGGHAKSMAAGAGRGPEHLGLELQGSGRPSRRGACPAPCSSALPEEVAGS